VHYLWLAYIKREGVRERELWPPAGPRGAAPINTLLIGGRLIVVYAVVSDWWCCRAGAVESSSAVVAGEVVTNRRGTHRWLYHTLGYCGGNSAHHGTRAGIPRGGGRPPTGHVYPDAPPLPKGTKCSITGELATCWTLWGRSYIETLVIDERTYSRVTGLCGGSYY